METKKTKGSGLRVKNQKNNLSTKHSSTTMRFASANSGKKISTGSQIQSEESLHKVFETALKEVYKAEQLLVEALPDLAEAAENEELRDVINEHLEETKNQVTRLEKIFDRLEIEEEEGECKAMEGVIEDCNRIIEEFEEGTVRDVALIMGAQKIEHFEITAYGSLCELAKVLEYDKIADMLEQTLEEEYAADDKLTDIAEEVNQEAYEMSEQEMPSNEY